MINHSISFFLVWKTLSYTHTKLFFIRIHLIECSHTDWLSILLVFFVSSFKYFFVLLYFISFFLFICFHRMYECAHLNHCSLKPYLLLFNNLNRRETTRSIQNFMSLASNNEKKEEKKKKYLWEWGVCTTYALIVCVSKKKFIFFFYIEWNAWAQQRQKKIFDYIVYNHDLVILVYLYWLLSMVFRSHYFELPYCNNERQRIKSHFQAGL